jgi:hypothetical protein
MPVHEHISVRAWKALTAGLVAATACALGGCASSVTTSTAVAPQGAGNGGGTSTSTPARAPTRPEHPRSTAVTRTATVTVTQTRAAATPECTAADLALSFLGQQGATGHGELGFAVRNTRSASCDTFGYPGVEFLDRAGAPIATRSIRTTSDFFGRSPLRKLIVAPGQTVSFRLAVTHGIASSAGCGTAYGLQVIAPNDTATMRVSIPGGAYECTAAAVSPMRLGTSAYP